MIWGMLVWRDVIAVHLIGEGQLKANGKNNVKENGHIWLHKFINLNRKILHNMSKELYQFKNWLIYKNDVFLFQNIFFLSLFVSDWTL